MHTKQPLPPLTRLTRFLGSLTMAVILLIVIAGVLAWGTVYEARLGTAAVQRFVYHAAWFQALLGFLAVNLTIAALERYPWQRRHVPFVLAHIGIILILVGGILGSRFGVEGQLVIPEGQAERTLETPGSVLAIHAHAALPGHPEHGQASQSTSDSQYSIPTRFESQAWVHEPNLTIPVPLGGRTLQLTIDRYYPDAVTDETITEDGPNENPAVQVRLAHEERQDVVWLFSQDPERFGVGWGDAHVLFLEPQTDEQLQQLLGRTAAATHPRGVVSLKLPGMKQPRDIPVPDTLNQVMRLDDTAYGITFVEYFPDFALAAEGPTSRSQDPNNPAVSFTLSGPEGTDAYLLFAFHPEFQAMHRFPHKIAADVSYTFAAGAALPPQCIGLIRERSGNLLAVSTDAAMARTVVNPVVIGTRYTHPSLGYQFEVAAYYPRAKVQQHITNRSDEVHAEAIHLIGREDGQTADAWLKFRDTAQLALAKGPVVVEYRPAQRELPVTVKLLDFRKIDYPGTQMAAGFESDVELSDGERGITLMRKISMNNPLRYRGYSFFQSSYIPGSPETTILSVRSDPGTPLVYAGFIIVILGVVSMFLIGRHSTKTVGHPRVGAGATKKRAIT